MARRMMTIQVEIKDNIDPIVALECVRHLIGNASIGTSVFTQEGLLWVMRHDNDTESNNFIVYKDENAKQAE